MMISCSLCDFQAFSKGNLTFHLNSVHFKDKEYMCRLCHFKTAYKGALTRHVNSVHLRTGKTKECPICGYITPSLLNLNSHLSVSHHLEIATAFARPGGTKGNHHATKSPVPNTPPSHHSSTPPRASPISSVQSGSARPPSATPLRPSPPEEPEEGPLDLVSRKQRHRDDEDAPSSEQSSSSVQPLNLSPTSSSSTSLEESILSRNQHQQQLLLQRGPPYPLPHHILQAASAFSPALLLMDDPISRLRHRMSREEEDEFLRQYRHLSHLNNLYRELSSHQQRLREAAAAAAAVASSSTSSTSMPINMVNQEVRRSREDLREIRRGDVTITRERPSTATPPPTPPISLPNSVRRDYSPPEISQRNHVEEEEDPLKCKLCHFQAPNSVILRNHLRIVHLNEIHTLKCPLCEYTSGSREDIRTHIEIEHAEELVRRQTEEDSGEIVAID